MTAAYGFSRTLDVPADQAIDRITAALKDEGFGILTRIDVHEVMKKKLDVDLPPYVILGACNPKLAHSAISAEREIGLLLPCNVLVREQDGETTVSIADPNTMGELADNADITPLMSEAEQRLRRALHAA